MGDVTMGYWKSTVERFKIENYSEHPWADTLKQALAAVEPDTLAKLESNGELWQTLPPKEQVRLVRLLMESVNFDGPGGNVAITFHPTGIESLTENQMEHAQ